MMLVAASIMTVVASVQAADVKVGLFDRGANNQLVAAQNVKYSISDAEGKIVADGAKAEISLDLNEGVYEITVEQALPNAQVRYGAQLMNVPAAGAEFSFEISPEGLVAVDKNENENEENENADNTSSTISKKPVRPAAPRQPQLPQQQGPSMNSGNSWAMLGMVGALIATAVSLGVDDDEPASEISPSQYSRR